jgi:hypothetical protein
MPGLERILRQYGGRVESHFWGFKPPGLRSLPAAFYHPPIPQYERFLRDFSSSGFQIGLAPLSDTPFCRCKTNNKFREYGASRIAGVYSNVEPYASCVREGETGLLVANDPGAWYQAMRRLIEQRELRERIQAAARKHVEEHYSQDRFVELFWEQLQRARHRAAGAPAGEVARRAGRAGRDGWPARPPAFPAAHRMAGSLIRALRRLRQKGLGETWAALRRHCVDRRLLAQYRGRLGP